MMVDPYSFGILKPEHHARLVADLEGFARDANIQPAWIYEPLPESVGATERAYLRGFRHSLSSRTTSGLVYTGKAPLPAIVQRMSAMAGCLTRNFIRAKMLCVGAVHDHLAQGRMPDYSCLLIPNFFMSEASGGHASPWQVGALLDLLVDRSAASLQTVLYVQDMKWMASQLGSGFRDLIETRYVHVEV
jgi:hypothetical protein